MRASFLVSVILAGHRSSVQLQGESDNDCCPVITVRNLEVSKANLEGEYKLKVKKDPKPEDVCVDGCIYTKDGSPDEYCFKESETIANLQCSV